MPLLNRAVGKSWAPTSSQALPRRLWVLSSAWPTGSARPGSCWGAEMAHKVPGCAYRVYPIGTFLLLASSPAMATIPALPMLADMEQQCHHDVFPLTGCWKKAILSSWDFHRDAQRCYYLPEFIFHKFSILWKIKVAECCTCSTCFSYENMNILFWTRRLQIFIKPISPLKNTVMFIMYTLIANQPETASL